jgi:hypothetical protein
MFVASKIPWWWQGKRSESSTFFLDDVHPERCLDGVRSRFHFSEGWMDALLPKATRSIPPSNEKVQARRSFIFFDPRHGELP